MPGLRRLVLRRPLSGMSLALVVLGATSIAGCFGGRDSSAPVSAKDLQKGLVHRLAEAGTPTTWVDCAKDLPGRVGATTRCEVNFGTDNAVTAVLTTIDVHADEVAWEVTGPELTTDQVIQRVSGLTAAQSTTCDSGLDGRPGDWVQCQITRNDIHVDQTVEVKEVKGLFLDVVLTPALPKQQTEDLLRRRLVANRGLSVDSATCPENLVGKRGNTMDCVATAEGREETYTLVVTEVSNGWLDFEIADSVGSVPIPPDSLTVRIPPEPAQVVAAPPVFAPLPAAPEPATVFMPTAVVPQPAPVVVAPEPAPVMVSPPLVAPKPAQVFVPEEELEPAPFDGVPHLPPGVPHLPAGDAAPAPGPFVPQAGAD